MLNAPERPTGESAKPTSAEQPSEGVPEQKPQASAEQKETAVKEHRIDPTGTYFIGNSDKPIDGDTLMRSLGESAQARQWQSRYDQMAQQVEQYKPVMQENANLKAQLAAIQRRQEIAELIKEQAPQQKPVQQADSFYDDEEITPRSVPQLDPNEIAKPIYSIASQVAAEQATQHFGDIDARIDERVRAIYEHEQEQRAIQERNRQWKADTNAVRINDYMENYGMERQEAERVAGFLDKAKLHELQAYEAFEQGNQDAAIEHFQTMEALNHEAVNQLAEQKIKHQEKQRQTELQEQLASGNFTGIDTKEVDTTPDYDLWKDNRLRLQKRQEAVKRAAAEMQARRATETALGGVAR